MFFSIIIPTYNRGYIIWKTIQSLIDQSYPHWELLIIDDGSTDDTKQVVAQFQHDSRIKYHSLPHQGSQFARNKGLELAQGNIVTYVDSDDYVYPHFLSAALDAFVRNPNKVFATINYNRSLELYDQDFHLVESVTSLPMRKQVVTIDDFYKWEVKTCGTGIFHLREVKDNGVTWDIQIKRFQDWDFILQLAEKYPDGYMFIPAVSFEYHQRYGVDGICSNATYKDWADGFESIYQKYKNSPKMVGQTWYPDRVNKYIKLQELADAKQIPQQIYEGLKMLKKQENEV